MRDSTTVVGSAVHNSLHPYDIHETTASPKSTRASFLHGYGEPIPALGGSAREITRRATNQASCSERAAAAMFGIRPAMLRLGEPGSRVVHPGSRFNFAVLALLCFLLVYTVVVLPLELCYYPQDICMVLPTQPVRWRGPPPASFRGRGPAIPPIRRGGSDARGAGSRPEPERRGRFGRPRRAERPRAHALLRPRPAGRLEPTPSGTGPGRCRPRPSRAELRARGRRDVVSGAVRRLFG